MSAFRHAALRADDFRTHLSILDHVRRNDPRRWEDEGLAANYDECRAALREWLSSVAAAALGEMSRLDGERESGAEGMP